MSTEDFSSNNQDPADASTGRGLRAHASTAASEQYCETEAKKTASRSRRASCNNNTVCQTPADTRFTPLADICTPQTQAIQAFTHTLPPTPDQSFYNFQCQTKYYDVPQHGNNPNPFQNAPMPSLPNQPEWDRALVNNQLFTLPDAGQAVESAGTAQFDGTPPTFHPEEEDELFDDPDANFPAPSKLLAAASAGRPVLAAQTLLSTLPAALRTTGVLTIAPLSTHPQVSTPQNLRVFPQATSGMSSTSVDLPPHRLLVRRVQNNSGTSSQATPIQSTAWPAPGAHPSSGQPLLRPRDSPPVVPVREKENAVHQLSSDEEESLAPTKKKSCKEHIARSIINVDPTRAPVVETSYNYIRLKVSTDERKTWLNQRAELTEFCEDVFDYALGVLKLDPRWLQLSQMQPEFIEGGPGCCCEPQSCLGGGTDREVRLCVHRPQRPHGEQ
ncbi:hypothetical protein B0H10DRAFT_1957237 [Mycena sp. CBHHK59/15]|nr:hypothetical protein B0H10DRAFT_1957237 [Mycena sp. CBHHK59/15]